MESRVNKYRNLVEEDSLRSAKNKDMYDTIYSNKEYDNVEETVTQVKSNEVNLDKLRELLKKEETSELQIVKKESSIDIPDLDLEEEKKYDLKDILSRAKDTKEEEPEKLRSLNNTNYDIFKGINVKDKSKEELQKEELKKMIDSVNNTSAINKLNDKELSLNLLSDLEATTAIDDEEVTEEVTDIDKSFYTSSLGFTSNDFEELKDLNNDIQKDNKIIKVLLVLILIFMIAVTAFMIVTFM